MKYLLLTMLISACGIPITSGCNLNNYGHRLGGDFRFIPDNRIESARWVKKYENHECFKCWEFDTNSMPGKLLVTHDIVKGKHHTFREVMDELLILAETKPVCIDVKKITNDHWGKVLSAAVDFQIASPVSVKIITSCKNKEKYDVYMDKAKELGIYSGYYNCRS
jgi:hypothetical protein